MVGLLVDFLVLEALSTKMMSYDLIGRHFKHNR